MTTARPAKTRNEGQWALGNREPLNDTEQIKHEDAPLNVRDRVLNVYAKKGFDSIDKSDLRGRFRWMGLYTQREQGYDGNWTGDEHIDTIEAKYFMMRVRSDGKPIGSLGERPSPLRLASHLVSCLPARSTKVRAQSVHTTREPGRRLSTGSPGAVVPWLRLRSGW